MYKIFKLENIKNLKYNQQISGHKENREKKNNQQWELSQNMQVSRPQQLSRD